MNDLAATTSPCRHPPLWRRRLINDVAYLERCLRRFFFARDVMEELRVFDERQDAGEARAILEAEGLLVAGIARQGRIQSCCSAAQLGQGTCGTFASPITPEMCVAEDEPLTKVILRLADRPFVLVRGVAGFSGFVAHTDFQKPPVRMFLFAVVSIVELRWQEWISDHFSSNDAWQGCLTPSRLEMARELMAERNRNGWNLDLVDCLQFSDRATIIMKTPELWNRTIFTSKGQARDRIRAIQQLRDDLAHSQDLLADDRNTIFDLARWLDSAFEQLKTRTPATGIKSGSDLNT